MAQASFQEDNSLSSIHILNYIHNGHQSTQQFFKNRRNLTNTKKYFMKWRKLRGLGVLQMRGGVSNFIDTKKGLPQDFGKNPGKAPLS